jgi:hypothetical protein
MKRMAWVLAAAMALAATAYALDGSISGYIKDNTDEDEFAVLGDSDDIDVIFDWPAGAEFWVTVYGRNHNELGDFDLNDGDTINLTGGGLFFLEVYSVSGSGAWAAEWADTD